MRHGAWSSLVGGAMLWQTLKCHIRRRLCRVASSAAAARRGQALNWQTWAPRHAISGCCHCGVSKTKHFAQAFLFFFFFFFFLTFPHVLRMLGIMHIDVELITCLRMHCHLNTARGLRADCRSMPETFFFFLSLFFTFRWLSSVEDIDARHVGFKSRVALRWRNCLGVSTLLSRVASLLGTRLYTGSKRKQFVLIGWTRPVDWSPRKVGLRPVLSSVTNNSDSLPSRAPDLRPET